MIVAVGSKNPPKVKAVKKIFSRHFKDIEVIGIDVASGVADQPMSDEEMYKGALNRATSAIKKVKSAKFGVGIEGGVHQYNYGWLERTMIVIVDLKGNVGIGTSGGVVMPQKIVDKLLEGKNLTEAIDELFGVKQIGKGIGMFGLFTKGVVTRTKGIEHGVAFALSRFLHENLF